MKYIKAIAVVAFAASMLALVGSVTVQASPQGATNSLYQEFDCGKVNVVDPAGHNAQGSWTTSDPLTLTSSSQSRNFAERVLILGHSAYTLSGVVVTNTMTCYYTGTLDVPVERRQELYAEIAPAWVASVGIGGEISAEFDPTFPTPTPSPSATPTLTPSPSPTPSPSATPTMTVEPPPVEVGFNINSSVGFGSLVTSTMTSTADLLAVVYSQGELPIVPVEVVFTGVSGSWEKHSAAGLAGTWVTSTYLITWTGQFSSTPGVPIELWVTVPADSRLVPFRSYRVFQLHVPLEGDLAHTVRIFNPLHGVYLPVTMSSH